MAKAQPIELQGPHLAGLVSYWRSRLGLRGVPALLVVCLATVPLAFVVYNSGQLSAERWFNLWSSRLPGLISNTFNLSIIVALGAFLLGVSAAWLTVRREFAGRRLAIWLMVLPLTIPTYVFAHIYTLLLEPDGWLGRLWVALFGEASLPGLHNVFGVGFVLSLASFSYVFLLVRDALSHTHRNLEEAARIQGAKAGEVFWRVNLPMLRPAIAAGLALVVLHVLSDFGAVSMLRYQTFTLSIYLQMNGRHDYQAAAGLSLVLVCLSLGLLVLERFFRRRQRYYSSAQARRFIPRRAGPLAQGMIWLWLGSIALLAFILPLAWMIDWSWQSWAKGMIDRAFWGYVGNSLLVSLVAACLAVLAALPVALYHARRRNLLGQAAVQLASVGFVLPGPVIALGVLAFVLAALPNLYGGMLALLLAMVIRFLPLAVQSQEAALQQLTPSIEQAGRSLGLGPLQNLWRVVLPMMRGGMISAWVLVFIDTLKELPATLILRPTGFDTLPVRIWIEASEEMLELAAPAALMLVIGTLPVLWLLMRPGRNGDRV